jgi:putative ABC transport system ATP-binding protein
LVDKTTTFAPGRGIRIEGLSKRYGQGSTAVDALKDVNMVVSPGEVVGLVGPSGSGKSTLLKCLGAVIEPTTGRMILGQDVIYDHGWKIPDLRALRRDKIGFVFQAPYLIPFLDVIDNVALLPMLAGVPNAEARKRALVLLTALDVQHRAKAMPTQLSGGEQQRVAIARAIVKRPEVLLCDEPTGALDYATGKLVLEVIERINRELGTTAVVITHNAAIAGMADRVLYLGGGRIQREVKNAQKLNPSELSW